MTELAGCVEGRYYPGVRGTFAAIPGDHIERYLVAAATPEAQGAVVDAGCGSGYGSVFFPAAKWYFGLDKCTEAVDYATECYGSKLRRFQIWDLVDSPWPVNGVDLVTAFEVIEHLWPRDWVAMVKGAHGALLSGGLLCMSCPVAAVGVDLATAEGGADPGPGHTRRPEEHEILGLLKGFQVETILRNGSARFGLHEGAQEGEQWTLFVKARRI